MDVRSYKKDKIRNEAFHNKIGVAPIEDKMC